MDASKNTVAALEAAVAAVKEAKVPKDLRVAAFNAAFYGSSPAPTDDLKALVHTPPPSPSVEESDGIAMIAQKLEVDSALAANKVAQQEVTYLVVAARQAIGLEEWTSTRTVLESAHDRGVHDTNVSKAITALDSDGLRFRGPKSKRE